MKTEIMYCKECKKFTLKKTCECGNKTQTPKPAKYSVDDKYSKYRILYKNEIQHK